MLNESFICVHFFFFFFQKKKKKIGFDIVSIGRFFFWSFSDVVFVFRVSILQLSYNFVFSIYFSFNYKLLTIFLRPLQKHAYLNILKILQPKKEKKSDKNF